MRKKSINSLLSQFKRLFEASKGERRMKVYFAYLRSFESRFNFQSHSKECKKFIKKYGPDFEV
jgi:hypothetical protein